MHDIRFDGQVAIITGAGAGLGRSHALQLAARGAHVIVNDIHTATEVAEEITAQGGSAQAIAADVTDPEAISTMLERIVIQQGRVDIVINNAGILRDRSFAKMSSEEFRTVMEVHVMGAFHITHAVWPLMKQQHYGRLLFTSSPSGLHGNFGQANYAAAKMALIGLMHTLAIEGQKYNIRANALAPLATTQMTATLLPAEVHTAMSAESISPAVAFLTSGNAPNGVILCAAAGNFSLARILESQGADINARDSAAAEELQARWNSISDMSAAQSFSSLDEKMRVVTEKLKNPPN